MRLQVLAIHRSLLQNSWSLTHINWVESYTLLYKLFLPCPPLFIRHPLCLLLQCYHALCQQSPLQELMSTILMSLLSPAFILSLPLAMSTPAPLALSLPLPRLYNIGHAAGRGNGPQVVRLPAILNLLLSFHRM